MFGDHNARTCLAICTPFAKVTGPRGDLIYDPISPLWHKARHGLHFPTNFNTTEVAADGLEVGDARSRVAAHCVSSTPPPEFLFFIDSDVIVPHDALTKLFFRARCRPDYDVFCGVYCLKNPSVPDPLIYRELGQGPFWDWAVGDLLTTEGHGIHYVHMGLTLIRTSLFQRLKDAGLVHGDGTAQDDEPFFCTQNYRADEPGVTKLCVGTEDIYFCDKVRRLGAKILVDTGVLGGHHDKASGVSYGLPWEDGPWKRGKWLPGPDGARQDKTDAQNFGGGVVCECSLVIGKDPDPGCPKCGGKGSHAWKLALDLGAGATRREWPGHRTYTTDIRPGTGADYVQDTLLLTLPDGHFDLTASSHHLEHIGRWDQERVWREVFRVTAPGGLTEHVVPSWDWAARKITAGEVDGHVLNVCVGAQEAHGYERTFNTHFMIYTKAIAQALAEQAGFVDVTCEDWRDKEELGYNLIIRGRRPAKDEPTPAPVVEPAAVPADPVPEGAAVAVDAVGESPVTGGAG